MKSFYLTVHSDGDTHLEHENSVGHFKIHFGHALDLVGKWEVGLSDIYYSIQFNLQPELDRLYFFIVKELNDETKKAGSLCVLDDTIPISNNILKKTIAKSLRDEDMIGLFMDNKLKISFDDSVGIKSAKILANRTMENILGLKSCEITSGESALGYAEMDINRAFLQQLYFYTNIIENQLVGTSHDQLLRIIPHDNKSTCNVSFSRIHYYPVNRQCVRDLEVDIRDRDFRPLSVHSGTLTATLHFRQVSNE